MGHLLSVFFAMFLSFGHVSTTATHHADVFIPPPEFINAADDIPSSHPPIARRIALNSYSEDACLSCRSTLATSQPQLILRAQR